MRVRSVDDVAAYRDAEVTTDGTGSGIERVGSTDEATTLADHVLALPNHGDDGRSAGDVLDETTVEWLLGQVNVVLLGELLGGNDGLERHQLISPLLKARDDLSDDLARDTVRLDHDVGSLGRSTEFTSDGLWALEVDSGRGESRVSESTTGGERGSTHVATSRGCASAGSLSREGTHRGGTESRDSRTSKHVDKGV